MDSLQSVIDYALAGVPITQHKDIYALLMTYHNTLLQESKNENSQGIAQ